MDRKMIVADGAFVEKLQGSPRPAEVCDAAGHSLGVLVPTEFYQVIVQAWADSQISPEMIEENRRCAAEGRVKSTAEVKEYLASLDRDVSAP